MTRTSAMLALASTLALVSLGSTEVQEPGDEATSEGSPGANAGDSAEEAQGGKESEAEDTAVEPGGVIGGRNLPRPTLPNLTRREAATTPLPRPRTPATGDKAAASAPRQAPAATSAAERGAVAACGEKPRPTGAHTFPPGESLVFDIDIMGVRAGTLTLSVDTPAGGGHSFTASTSTNTFFANVRQVEGRATSFSRDGSLYPLRYREDSTEDGVEKWTEVLFPHGRNEVDVRFGMGQRERRVRYPVTDTPLDLISLIYYLRTLNLAVGDTFCLDIYANRRVWRISGAIDGEEFVRTPAGAFETWRLTGKAQRLDMPSYEREVHVWIAQDERRTPVAAMSNIDLGPVRARLSRHDGTGATQRPVQGGGRW